MANPLDPAQKKRLIMQLTRRLTGSPCSGYLCRHGTARHGMAKVVSGISSDAANVLDVRDIAANCRWASNEQGDFGNLMQHRFQHEVIKGLEAKDAQAAKTFWPKLQARIANTKLKV